MKPKKLPHTLILSLYVSALMFLCLANGDNALAKTTKPNIIFIMADDMGYGDAGCYGQTLIKTPNIDLLAKEGRRFTQCYAGSTVCAPSRSVLMTGQHTGHTRVRGNFGVGGVRGLGGATGRIPLKESDITVAEVLKSAGYQTGMMGKWGLGEPGTSGEPNRKGFDTWFGYLNQRRAHSYYPEYLWLNRERFALPGNQDGNQSQYSHDLIVGFATHFIRQNQHAPFFLYLPFTIPHSQFQVPDYETYAAEDWPEQAKIYAAMITRMDRDIGTLIQLLDDLKLTKNTVLFFCSDNGAANRYDGLFNSSGPLRGRKRDLFEGGLRTPMIVRWPGMIPAGTVSASPWTFADFLPTAAELAGALPPQGGDGMSILPSLLGQAQALEDRFLYWEFFERGFQRAARWRDWKAVIPEHHGTIQLYNLNTDLGETTNIAEAYPDIVARFQRFFEGARTDSSEFPIRSTQ